MSYLFMDNLIKLEVATVESHERMNSIVVESVPVLFNHAACSFMGRARLYQGDITAPILADIVIVPELLKQYKGCMGEITLWPSVGFTRNEDRTIKVLNIGLCTSPNVDERIKPITL